MPADAPPAPRTSDLPVDPIFLDRWSPRAFTGEGIARDELLTILEAARWAPSAFNAQPWRFAFVRRESPLWADALGVLLEFNRVWAANAAALVVIGSQTTMRLDPAALPAPSQTHSFDAGAAWGFLALQAARSGWAAHAVAGFDKALAATVFQAPADLHLDAIAIVGRRGPAADLPEKLAAREHPSPRRPLDEIAFEGRFNPA